MVWNGIQGCRRVFDIGVGDTRWSDKVGVLGAVQMGVFIFYHVAE